MERSPKSTLFVRSATGLVRSWSLLDAVIYGFMSTVVMGVGLYTFSQMYYLPGSLIGAMIVSVFFITFECLVYGGLVAVMPRAGGDYVWQSRILGPGVGFILSLTGWVFILWLWLPIYGDYMRFMFFTPVLALLGLREAAAWFSLTPAGAYVSSVITVGIISVIVALGMRVYARVQKWCFFIGMAGLAVIMLVLLFGNSSAFQAGLNNQAPAIFGAESGDVYQATIAAGDEAGATNSLGGGWGLGAIFLTVPYLVFFNLYPNWGATLYGEVRGASDFKRNFLGMFLSLVISSGIAVLLFLLINKGIGWDFYMRANGAYWNYVWGYTEAAPPLPFWPSPVVLAMMLTNSRLVQLLFVLVGSLFVFGSLGTAFLSSTRVLFAAAFDRMLPEWVSNIHPKWRSPVNALLVMALPSLIVAALFAWNVFGFRSLTLDSMFAIALTYLGSTIAATVLPFVKKDIYSASPIAKYKVLGVPLITVGGVIFSGFLVYLIYMWLIDPQELYGISYRNLSSIIFMLILYGLSALIYVGFRIYRKRQGVDIQKVYEEIPIE